MWSINWIIIYFPLLNKLSIPKNWQTNQINEKYIYWSLFFLNSNNFVLIPMNITHAHTHTHAHIHTRTHARTHMCTPTYAHADVRTCARTHMHACTHAHIHACTHACTHTCTYACTHASHAHHTRMHTHMHICMHTRITRACTHACTHTCTYACTHASHAHHTRMHTHMHICMHTRITHASHTHACIHIGYQKKVKRNYIIVPVIYLSSMQWNEKYQLLLLRFCFQYQIPTQYLALPILYHIQS